MKNQSLIFKVLGAALLAVLAWALYDIASQILPVVIFPEGGNSYRAFNEHALINSFWSLIPYVILIVFFIFLFRDYPNSKTAKYAFWISVAGVAMLVFSYVFQYLADVKTEDLEKLIERMMRKGDYDAELIEDKADTIRFLEVVSGYLSSAKMLLVFALPFAANTLRNNKKLVVAVFIAMAAMLFEEFFQIHTLNISYYRELIDIENRYIMMMVRAALCFVAFAYLFYAYSQKDAPEVTENKTYSAIELGAIAGVLVAAFFFFTNWIDHENISDYYLTLGCHVVPIAALGIMVMPIAILSVLEKNRLAKKISAAALIVWPLIVCLATWNFEVHDGQTVGEIIREGNRQIDDFKEQFNDATRMRFVVLYTLSSIAAGVLILWTIVEKKPVKVRRRVLTKDEQIARLQAELAALKNQVASPAAPEAAHETAPAVTEPAPKAE